jgi:hypothetical protein
MTRVHFATSVTALACALTCGFWAGAQSQGKKSETSGETLSLSLDCDELVVDQDIIVSVTNTGSEPLAVPEESELLSVLYIGLAAGSELKPSKVPGPGLKPRIIMMRLKVLKPGESMSIRIPTSSVLDLPPKWELWHMHATLIVPELENEIEGVKTWSGTIGSDWEHFIPERKQP